MVVVVVSDSVAGGAEVSVVAGVELAVVVVGSDVEDEAVVLSLVGGVAGVDGVVVVEVVAETDWSVPVCCAPLVDHVIASSCVRMPRSWDSTS